jgi:hypothetical protein
MLTVETIGRIRRAHFLKGKTIKEIARDPKVSRNTVRKVLRSGVTSFEYERKTSRSFSNSRAANMSSPGRSRQAKSGAAQPRSMVALNRSVHGLPMRRHVDKIRSSLDVSNFAQPSPWRWA